MPIIWDYVKSLFDKPDRLDHRVLMDPYTDCWSSNTCLITLLLIVVLSRHEGMDAENITFIFIWGPELVMHLFVNMKLVRGKEKYHLLNIGHPITVNNSVSGYIADHWWMWTILFSFT